jgi:hypothetical protein
LEAESAKLANRARSAVSQFLETCKKYLHQLRSAVPKLKLLDSIRQGKSRR